MLTTLDLGPYTPHIEAICEALLSETPRLVLADWLDETGRLGADALRAWVATWPALEAAWRRGLEAIDTADRIPRRAPPIGTLAAVMTHRLTLTTYPIPWADVSTRHYSWDPLLARRVIDESLVLVELAALGVLPADAAAQAELQEMYRMVCAACDRAWEGPEARLTRAVKNAMRSALSAAESAQPVRRPFNSAGGSAISIAYAASLVGDAAAESETEHTLRRAAAALYRSSHWRRVASTIQPRV